MRSTGFPSSRIELRELEIEGRILGVESFLRLAIASAIVVDIRRSLLARSSEAPLLAKRAEGLPRLEELESEIRRIIDVETETVRDDASKELQRIRESSRKLEAKLGKLLEQALASRDNQKLLQESLVTSRNNRPVVPIKAECRSQFPGIVHGASASGATLFVEPIATVEISNDLAILRDREREEIRKILAELTARVRPRRAELAFAVQVLAVIDLAQAKGRLSDKWRGEAPVLTEESELRLIEARHPLLPSENAVPLTFGLAPGKRGLVFTGPNTGGKTVALKTAGLLSLMAQSGLHVPARSSSVFPLFRSIFADIGDDQSIGSSLSTFSSHLAKVVSMERELELPALVILDEVGTGTDPAEGGALGTALVEHFLERGALVLASTHHGLLKAYALTHEGIGAASFEFDPLTYAPTYRIAEGAAGRSLAFEMAERLGLPRAVVARARELESERERQVRELVSRLEAENAEIERERARAAEDRQAAEESRLRIEAREEEERQERRKRLSAFRASLEEEVDQTRRELRDVVAEAKRTIAEIRASRQEDRARLQELEKTLSNRIEAKTAPLLEKVTANEERTVASPESIRPGTRVLVASFGMEGFVDKIAGDQAEVTVRDKKLKLPLASLEALPPVAPAPPAAWRRKRSRGKERSRGAQPHRLHGGRRPEPGGQISGRRAPERVSSGPFDPRSRYRTSEKRVEGMAFDPPRGREGRKRQPWRGHGRGAEGLAGLCRRFPRNSSTWFGARPTSSASFLSTFPSKPGRQLQGTLPLPQRKDSVLPREPRASDLPLLRLRSGRRRLQVPDALREALVRRSHRAARVAGRSQDPAFLASEPARGRRANAPPEASRRSRRVFSRPAPRVERRGEGARIPEDDEVSPRRPWRPTGSASLRTNGPGSSITSPGRERNPSKSERAGLAVPRKTGKGFYDRFRSRIMIPIRGESGRTVAFGGRILGEGEPKYLNSPESPIYNKSAVLYGFDRAKDAIRKEGSAILMEGYLDCLQAYQAGIGHAVACCGTSLTKGHARLLRRYTERVVVNFDPDAAGERAARRSIDLLLEEGFEVRVLRLPDGEDPDSFLLKQGAPRIPGAPLESAVSGGLLDRGSREALRCEGPEGQGGVPERRLAGHWKDSEPSGASRLHWPPRGARRHHGPDGPERASAARRDSSPPVSTPLRGEVCPESPRKGI